MTYSYLALGDSYTIGEQVKLTDSFPYQSVQLLREKGIPFYAPEIIAATGWTTHELNTHIEKIRTLEKYDMVSLLIGVNDQYRGRSINEFTVAFEHLLMKAIGFAGENPAHVFVLSIPDWGVTPFAAQRDRNTIAGEIDAFNEVCSKTAEKYNANYINITQSQRTDGNNLEYLADDGLHPSGKEYAKWAIALSESIKLTLANG